MMADLTPEQIELLLAVTDGSLEGQELEDARARAESDPVLAEELRLQELALAHLAEERVAPMADFEAARMRRNVLDEVLPLKPAKAPWFSRLVPAAAVIAFVVIGIGFLGNLGSDDGADIAQDEIAAVAPAETDSATVERAEESEMAAAPAADDSADMDMAGDAPMEAPAEEAPLEDISSALPKVELPDLGALEDGPLDEERLSLLEESLDGVPTPLFVVTPACDGVEFEDEMVLEVVGAGITVVDGTEARVVLLADGRVLDLDIVECTVTGSR
jgi:hypothetical protein